MKHTAGRRRIQNDTGNFKHQGIFQRLMSRPLLTLTWIAVCIACIMPAVLVFIPRPNSPSLLSSYFQSAPNIFRTKIPAETKKQAKIFRAKVPVVHLPEKQVTKAESAIGNKNQVTAAQPMVAAFQKTKPVEDVGLRSTLDSPDDTVIIPPKAAVPSSPPMLEISEQGEPERDSRRHPPAESEIKTVTPPPLAKIDPSQSADLGLQQKETPEKPARRQSEVRLQPVKEIDKEKTEERSIHSEAWLLSQESSRYTIQIMGARDDALLFDFVNRNQLLEQNEIAYYQTTFQGRPWFQLLYGIYPSKRAAQSAAEAFPPEIRKSSPWIRRLSGVQAAIRKHATQ
jgi:septal ring-binding cell division protein DamX